MSQSRTPQTKPSIPVPQRTSENAPAPSSNEEIPRGEFIDVLTNKPVEPSRLQVFPVPQEFLNKVHASNPPHLRPDDMKDTVPSGLPQPRPVESVRPSAKTPLTAPVAQPMSSAAAPISPARANTVRPRTAAHRKPRPPASALTRWALTGKVPRSVKVGFVVLLGGLLVILIWQNWDAVSSESTSTGEPVQAVPSGPVPLIDAPMPVVAATISVASRPEPVAVPVAASGANDPEPTTAVLSISELPAIPETLEGAAALAKKAEPPRAATTAAPASKSSGSTGQAQAVTVTSSSPRITPLFEPR